MNGSPSPLRNHLAFRALEFETLAGVLESQLGAKFGRVARPSHAIEAQANRLNLPLGELWFCSYGVPISVQFPDNDVVRIQFQMKGSGATKVRGETIEVSERQACVTEGATEIDFGIGFQQVVWRAPRSTLIQKLAKILNGPVTGDLEFAPKVDLNAPSTAALKHVLGSMLVAADTISAEAGRMVLAELEEAFVVSLLAAADHSHREAINRPTTSAAPWQVRRAEAYIAENWSHPITIDDLVDATGVSARTLFRTFRAYRGCTPREFARRIRLERARDLIEAGDDSSMTEIAFSCGFADLSHFSKSFMDAFGENPSALRKRRLRS